MSFNRAVRLMMTGLVGLALAACATATAPTGSGTTPTDGAATGSDASALQGIVWQWEALSGAPSGDLTIAEPKKYTIEFLPEGQYHIVADCNSGSGQYRMAEGTLTLEPGPMTLVACDPDSHSDSFIAQLREVEGVRVDEQGQLLLSLRGDAGTLRFSPSVPGATSLEGTEWQLTSILIGDGRTRTPVDSEITALFADGMMSGSAGCNRYNASYESDGTSLTLGPAAATRMACDEPLMAREREFLTALEGVTGYTIERGTLQLTGMDGQIILTFEAQG